MKVRDTKYIQTFIVLITSLLLTGCFSVDMYSQRNPQWHGQPLKKVMVIGDFKNLIYRHYTEGQMCDYITEYSDTICLESLDYLFAGQGQDAQVSAVLNREKVDGVIYVSTQAHGTTMTDQPMIFNAVQWAPGFSTIIGYGGTRKTQWANYSVKLYIRSGAMIWYANADASGSPEDTIEHSSYHIAKELVKAGIILPKGRK